MSQQTDALFESDDSFEEVAAASLPVDAATCPVSAVSRPASNTRPNPTKRWNESDSEVEINNSIKLSLLKNEQRWVFVNSHKIIVVNPTSDYWPEGVDFIQRSTPEGNQKDRSHSWDRTSVLSTAIQGAQKVCQHCLCKIQRATEKRKKAGEFECNVYKDWPKTKSLWWHKLSLP